MNFPRRRNFQQVFKKWHTVDETFGISCLAPRDCPICSKAFEQLFMCVKSLVEKVWVHIGFGKMFVPPLCHSFSTHPFVKRGLNKEPFVKAHSW